MKLIDALKIINDPVTSAEPFQLFLATGFSPLHLQTFLAAEAQQRLPGSKISVIPGRYDDLAGNIQRIGSSGVDVGCVIVEWPDLDPRLGVRRLTPWTYKDFDEILRSVADSAERLICSIDVAQRNLPVCVCLPTLPIMPYLYSPSITLSPMLAELHSLVAQVENRLLKNTRAKLISRHQLDYLSTQRRFDLESELAFGFPYSVAHSGIVAKMIVDALFPKAPKKGLITDLDDTLWSGVLGEVGVDDIHWDLQHNAQLHGLYQRLLHSLAAEGILIAVVSKNSLDTINEAFQRRSDLLVSKQDIFPLQGGWGRKSDSVSVILNNWNISADSVVFVDDNPLELAEVKNTHGEMECIPFPESAAVFLPFWERIRELFAKSAIHQEDSVRVATLRATTVASDQLTHPVALSPDEFLKELEAELLFEMSTDADDARALQLVNKTTQFNLNGVRHNEASWKKMLRAPGAFLLTASYQDKFGPLGKIAVVQGRAISSSIVNVDCWVMSCRAFSRRIEFACLARLFEHFRVETISLAYKPAERNLPVMEFLKSLRCGSPGVVTVTRSTFEELCPPLFHKVSASTKSSQLEEVPNA
jgi:FkbH-like protein